MTQQTSPFLETKYGWNYGESGWNNGMDENLLKYSFLFDRNIDGIVSSLPSVVNGTAYFLTTDGRIYFGVSNAWYSTLTPKWFTLVLRSTGAAYQFNGTSLVAIASNTDLSTQVQAIQVTLSTLGTAAFEDVDYFASASELDVASAQANAYTDTLRTDLLSPSGSINVGYEDSNVKGSLDSLFLTASKIRRVVQTVSELRLTPGSISGERIELLNYSTNDRRGRRLLTWAPGAEVDDGGMTFAATGGSWISDLMPTGWVNSEFYGMPLANGADCYSSFNAMYTYCKTNKISMFCSPGPFGAGRYNFGSASCPISGPRNPGQALVSMGFKTICTSNVTFETISNGGADVFNICSIADWSLLGFPNIRGTILTPDGSGSNGVSMVFGAENIIIEANIENMPQVWTTGGGSDGGHGFTIQFGTGNTNPYKNVVFRGYVKGCTTGVNIDFSTSNTILYPIAGINIDGVVAEDCYRGITRGGTTPDTSIVDPRTPQPCCDISGYITLINCQQSVVDIRSLGGNLKASVVNSKEKADLIINPNDTSVEVARVLGSKFGSLEVNARVLSVDKVLDIGAIGMGGNAYASIENFKFKMSVRYTSATTEFSSGLAGSPPCRSSSIYLDGFVNTPSEFHSSSLRTSLSLNGITVAPTLYPGDAVAEPSSGATVIFNVPLTTSRTAFTPPAILSSKGDPITIIRTSDATGGDVVFAGVSVGVGTKALFIYNGTAWDRMP